MGNNPSADNHKSINCLNIRNTYSMVYKRNQSKNKDPKKKNYKKKHSEDKMMYCGACRKMTIHLLHQNNGLEKLSWRCVNEV